MGAVEALTTINAWTVIVDVFVILAAIRYMLEIIGWFKNKFGIKTGDELENDELKNTINTLEKHDEYQYGTIKKVLSKLDEVMDRFKDIDSRLDSIEVRDMRSEVLDFANSIINGRQHTIQEFDNIKIVIKQYEKLIDLKKIQNGQLEHAIIVINKKYDELIESDGFLK